jgi:ATP-dependent protease HslVU (ClpYQ) peptidase subunit
MEYSRFWATGSGCEFAIGSMESIFDQAGISAREVVERALAVACVFDDRSGEPIESDTIALIEC